MLSRRSLIIGSSAAFIARPALSGSSIVPLRNPLAFPGGQARLNTNHFAAARTRFAWVADPTSIGGQVLFSTGPYLIQSAPASASLVQTQFGPTTLVPAAGGNQGLLFNGSSVISPTAVTFACIFFFVNTFASTPFILGAGQLYGLCYTGGGQPVFLSIEIGVTGTNLASSTIALAQSQMCFAAMTFNGAKYNAVMRNLITGVVTTDTGSSAKALGTTSAGQYAIGGYGASGNNSNCEIAASMFSINQYFTLPELIQWAANPWDLWYPTTQLNVMANSLELGSGPASHGGFRPLMGVGQ